MPFCEACARHWTPTSMRPDGSCPACGQVLELRKPLPAPAAAGGTGTGGEEGVDPAGAEDEEAPPKAPWHFKVLLVAVVVYLAWRGVQGIDWIAHRL